MKEKFYSIILLIFCRSTFELNSVFYHKVKEWIRTINMEECKKSKYLKIEVDNCRSTTFQGPVYDIRRKLSLKLT